MENLLVECRHDQAARSRVLVARTLAQVARKDGIDGAREWLIAQLAPRLGNPPDATVAALGLFPIEHEEEWTKLLRK